MNTDDSDKANDSTDELDKIKEILGLEFKNLANEIFDEKTKKITDLNKENISSILNPLREIIDDCVWQPIVWRHFHPVVTHCLN